MVHPDTVDSKGACSEPSTAPGKWCISLHPCSSCAPCCCVHQPAPLQQLHTLLCYLSMWHGHHVASEPPCLTATPHLPFYAPCCHTCATPLAPQYDTYDSSSSSRAHLASTPLQSCILSLQRSHLYFTGPLSSPPLPLQCRHAPAFSLSQLCTPPCLLNCTAAAPAAAHHYPITRC